MPVVPKSFIYVQEKVSFFGIVGEVCQPLQNQKRNQVQMKLDISGVAHTKWEWKYYIVFAPQYRRQIVYGKIKQDRGVEIIEAEACKDHIHMLVWSINMGIVISGVVDIMWAQ